MPTETEAHASTQDRDWHWFRGDGTVRSLQQDDEGAVTGWEWPGERQPPAIPRWRAMHGRKPRTEASTPPGADLQAVDSRARRAFSPDELDAINLAILLRRPLLVDGRPGTGKSVIAYAIAQELALGKVLKWPINSRTTLQDGLYRYDAVARFHATGKDAGAAPYIRLGPLGSAFVDHDRPRVLLIDEIDKGSLDLPNDLLHVLEDAEFAIDELQREHAEAGATQGGRTDEVMLWDSEERVPVVDGRVSCSQFPIIILTNNQEREFPAAFKRRCLRLTTRFPEQEDVLDRQLLAIAAKHLADDEHLYEKVDDLTATQRRLFRVFKERVRGNETVAVDQLLRALYAATTKPVPSDDVLLSLLEKLE